MASTIQGNLVLDHGLPMGNVAVRACNIGFGGQSVKAGRALGRHKGGRHKGGGIKGIHDYCLDALTEWGMFAAAQRGPLMIIGPSKATGGCERQNT
jgi:hypothetical protein